MTNPTKTTLDRLLSEANGYSQSIQLLVLSGLALVTRIALLDRAPRFDEFYHYLAARSWADTGTLAILDGSYQRAEIFTKLVGSIFLILNTESWEAARFASLIFGVLLVIVVFVWAKWCFGSIAAWTIGLLLIFWPSGIELSQTLRFYALHGLLFVTSSILLYISTVPTVRKYIRFVFFLAALSGYGFATHFQITTLVGLVGVSLWCSIMLFVYLSAVANWRTALYAYLIGLLITVPVVVWQSESLYKLLVEFRHAQPWASDWQDNYFFYITYLREHYPLFLVTAPLLGLAAAARYPRVISFCLCVLLIGITLHSLAGMKHWRYIYYLMPFFFVIVGVGLVVTGEVFFKFARHYAGRVLRIVSVSDDAGAISRAIAILVVVFAILINPFAKQAIAFVLGVSVQKKQDSPWLKAKSFVAKLRGPSTLLVASNELRAIYYFGGYDVLYSSARQQEIAHVMKSKPKEFVSDWRTGRPVIGKISSLATLIACKGDVVIVINKSSRSDVGLLIERLSVRFKQFAEERFGELFVMHWKGRRVPGDNCAVLSGIRNS